MRTRDRSTPARLHAHARAHSHARLPARPPARTHARSFMDILRPMLPDSPLAELLRQWDLRYTQGSAAAVLFERFYRALTTDVRMAADGNGGVAMAACCWRASCA